MIKRLTLVIVSYFLLTMQFPYTAFAHNTNSSVNIVSESAILMDAKTGSILYSKNSKTSMYPASLTKIATAIIAIEEGNLEDIVTVSENARNIEGTRVYLEIDEQVPLFKLVQGILISSGNDAATAIAEYFDGSSDDFSERMNEFIKQKVGLKNTTFRNPHGLHHPEQTTTAYDLATLTKYAIKNDTFREIFGTNELEWDGEGWQTTLYHHNQLIRQYEGTTGGKTGYVTESGNTLITTAQRGNTELIAVVLQAPGKDFAYEDTTTLLDYGFENFETHVIPKNTSFQNSEHETVHTTKNHYYTTEKDAVVDIEVTDKNELSIQAEDGEILLEEDTVIKLDDTNQDMAIPETKTDATKTEKAKTNESNFLGYLLFVVILIGVILGLIIYKIKKTTK